MKGKANTEYKHLKSGIMKSRIEIRKKSMRAQSLHEIEIHRPRM